MQNTSTIYHIESVMELQIVCLACSIMWGDDYKTMDYTDNAKVHRILNALMFEHIFAYLCDYFRKWEVMRNG